MMPPTLSKKVGTGAGLIITLWPLQIKLHGGVRDLPTSDGFDTIACLTSVAPPNQTNCLTLCKQEQDVIGFAAAHRYVHIPFFLFT